MSLSYVILTTSRTYYSEEEKGVGEGGFEHCRFDLDRDDEEEDWEEEEGRERTKRRQRVQDG